MAVRRKKQREEALIKKVARKLREIYYGPKTYLPKKRKPTVKPTVRTKDITKSLRSAGLTQEEINRLRGKKR